MKQLLLLLLTIFSLPALAQTSSQQSLDDTKDKEELVYEQFTTNLANQAISIVMSSDTNETQITKFRELFLENCQLRYIGRFVLGQYWKKLDNSNQEEFLEAFTNSVIMGWAVKFNSFKGGTLEINSVNKSENPNSSDYFINSTMTFTDGMKPAEVIWRERKDKSGNIKVVDIIIEGVSMAMTYRNEYRSVLQRNNGNVRDLISSLDIKTQELQSEFSK